MSESGSIERIIEEYKNIQMKFLNFLDNEENIEADFHNLIQFFKDIKIRDNQHNLRLFFHLLLRISNDHYRCPNFFGKIEQILQFFKDDIKKYYSNSEIFDIFQSSKRILLFLIEEKILRVDEYFYNQITKDNYLQAKYPQYFAPEIKPFTIAKFNPNNSFYLSRFLNRWDEEVKKGLPENFYELRKIGENESEICKLIREDSVKEFIAYMNKNSISCNKEIELSIYETNSYFFDLKTDGMMILSLIPRITLIEYAAFFGSIQIFNFLKSEGAELNSSLWFGAIHSKNAEIIHILEENNIQPTITVLNGFMRLKQNSYKECFSYSIKCHNNDAVNYFLTNCPQNEDENPNEIFNQSLEYYNFAFFQNELINESSFNDLCSYDYFSLVNALLISKDIDINKETI